MEGLKEGEDVREGGREEPSQGEGPTEAEHQASEEDGVPFGAGEKGGREGGREGGRAAAVVSDADFLEKFTQDEIMSVIEGMSNLRFG